MSFSWLYYTIFLLDFPFFYLTLNGFCRIILLEVCSLKALRNGFVVIHKEGDPNDERYNRFKRVGCADFDKIEEENQQIGDSKND